MKGYCCDRCGRFMGGEPAKQWEIAADDCAITVELYGRKTGYADMGRDLRGPVPDLCRTCFENVIRAVVAKTVPA